MRKRLSTICVLTLFLIVAFCSCSSKIDDYSKVISELRVNEFVGYVGENKAYAVTGIREKEYKIDGVSGEKTEFFILTVEGEFADPLECSVVIEETEYSGVMKKHPFSNSYSFEIAKRVNENAISVAVSIGQEVFVTTLNSVLNEECKTHEYAFSLAKQELSNAIKKHEKKGVFDGEVYVRIIPNPTDEDGRYFWYVAFYKSAQECYSILIDCKSGEIMARKGEQ